MQNDIIKLSKITIKYVKTVSFKIRFNLKAVYLAIHKKVGFFRIILFKIFCIKSFIITSTVLKKSYIAFVT